MTSKIHLQAIWNIRYNKLFKDLDEFRREWDDSLKKCKCKNPECKHYQDIKWRRFGVDMQEIFLQSIIMNACSFREIANQSQAD